VRGGVPYIRRIDWSNRSGDHGAFTKMTSNSHPLWFDTTVVGLCRNPACPEDSTCTCGVSSGSRVFVTSTKHQGNFGGLNGGDQICQERADAAGLDGTFMAWLSSDDEDAKYRIGAAINEDTELTLVDGTVVANNWSHFINSSLNLNHSINKNELGNEVDTLDLAWTGTNASGTRTTIPGGNPHANCGNWLSNDSVDRGMSGQTSYTTEFWTFLGTRLCDQQNRLYCIEIEEETQCTTDQDCDDGNQCTLSTCDNDGVCQDLVLQGETCVTDDGQDGICNQDGMCESSVEGQTNLILTFSLEGAPYCEGESCFHPPVDHPAFVNDQRGINATVTLLNPSGASFVKNQVLFNYDENSKTFTNQGLSPMIFDNIPAGPYMVFIKGPMHLATRYCYLGTRALDHCTFDDLVTANINYHAAPQILEPDMIYLQDGIFNLDLSARGVKAGDLSISGDNFDEQDGKVNVNDYSFLVSCLEGEHNQSTDCLSRTSLKLTDTITNVDLGLLRKTMLEVFDEM